MDENIRVKFLTKYFKNSIVCHCSQSWCLQRHNGRVNLRTKQSDLEVSTANMLRRLQLEKALLLGKFPSVALGNIKKFPWLPPGEHSADGLGSCYIYGNTL